MGDRKIKVSLCVTIYNEEDTIEELLQSIFSQSKRPDEIIVCDGGSKDGSVDIIKKLQRTHKEINLIIAPGSVAHGRNAAIKNAKNEIIASIDAGCIAKKDWLEKLVRSFDKQHGIDIVAGFYQMKWKNSFQRIMALYRGTPPERYDINTFIPSCRSVAFRKSVWEEVGGFNESLALSGEDTQFFYNALQNGAKIVRVPDALVEWKEPEQFGFKDFKKFFYYARGDAQTGIWWDPVKKWRTHNIKILSIYFRYLIFATIGYFIFLGFLGLFIIYITWSVWKWRGVVRKWNHRLWIPVIQVGTDLMVMAGFLTGLLR